MKWKWYLTLVSKLHDLTIDLNGDRSSASLNTHRKEMKKYVMDRKDGSG